MLARLTMKIKSDKEISYNKASLFHGALMELIASEYAEKLHSGGLNPYSQFLRRVDGDWYWVVQTLNGEAKENMIDVLRESKFSQLFLEHAQTEIEIEEKQFEEIPVKSMLQEFYFRDKARMAELTFMTPTSFKQKGQYLIYPDLRCLYQSLMRKYGMARQEDMESEESLEQLVEGSKIIQYNLRSCYFNLEGVKIPSFSGKIRIKITGPQTMVNFAHLLLKFGEYSGVGVKTSIGMGALQIREVAKFDK